MALDGTLGATFIMNDRRTVGVNANANIPINLQVSIAFSNGSGAGQVATLYQETLALSGGTLSLNLNGVLTDSYGTLVNLVRVKGVFLQNNSTSNPMIFGAAPSNPWATFLNATGTLTLPPGAWNLAGAPGPTGWTVTPGTGAILQVTGTGTDPFIVAIIGSPT